MFKSIAARLGATAASLALMGTAFAAIPAETVSAGIAGCPVGYPQIRTTTAVAAPYGVSASVADQITVKVINSSSTPCEDPVVTIYPREGFVFHSIVSTTGGYMCETPGAGNPGPVQCYADTIAKYSSSTIRVRYDRITPGGAVSGTASSEVDFDDCKRIS